jgi:hypothetical protein
VSDGPLCVRRADLVSSHAPHPPLVGRRHGRRRVLVRAAALLASEMSELAVVFVSRHGMAAHRGTEKVPTGLARVRRGVYDVSGDLRRLTAIAPK